MKKIFLIVILIFLFLPLVIFATACPLGKVNDPAPGSCGLYQDTNKDGYCDLSQTEESTNLINKEDAKAEDLKEQKVEKPEHRIGLITIILIAGYFVSLFFVSKKKISLIKHRQFWNWLLLIFFIPTATTSIVLALFIEFGVVINLGIDIGFWHFVFGWAFLVVSLFHFLWHINYYFKKKIKK